MKTLRGLFRQSGDDQQIVGKTILASGGWRQGTLKFSVSWCRNSTCAPFPERLKAFAIASLDASIFKPTSFLFGHAPGDFLELLEDC